MDIDLIIDSCSETWLIRKIIPTTQTAGTHLVPVAMFESRATRVNGQANRSFRSIFVRYTRICGRTTIKQERERENGVMEEEEKRIGEKERERENIQTK